MATLIKASGDTLEVQPANGKDFKLKELYKLLNCNLIEIIRLSDGRIMVADEEGKCSDDHEVNLSATLLFREGRMSYHQVRAYFKKLEEAGTTIIDASEVMGEDYIAGDVIVCNSEEVL